MDEQQVEQQRGTKVLANGTVYDLDKGRIVSAANVTTKITPERSLELHSRRQELKRERLLAGAAKTLERTGDWETPSDLDVVEAIGEAAMERALDGDVKNSKQIDAMRFILNEGGLSETQQQAGQPGSDAYAAIGAVVVEYVRRLHEGVVRTDIPISHEDAHSSAVDSDVSSSPADTETGQ